MQNFKFVSSAAAEILGGSPNLKSGSRDLGHAPFDKVFIFLVENPLRLICMQNLKFVSLAVAEILGGPKI